MNPKEIIKRCNNMIKRLAHEAYGKQNSEAIKDINTLDEVIEIVEMQEPLKSMQAEMDTDGSAIIPCGYCGEELRAMYNYCPWCGITLTEFGDDFCKIRLTDCPLIDLTDDGK